jgi:hypothetical protein
MQTSTNLDRVLRAISELSVEEQLYLSDLLGKRLSEVRRTKIASRVLEAEENYRSGNIRSGTIAALMMESEND